jgi:hypothetical protein
MTCSIRPTSFLSCANNITSGYSWEISCRYRSLLSVILWILRMVIQIKSSSYLSTCVDVCMLELHTMRSSHWYWLLMCTKNVAMRYSKLNSFSSLTRKRGLSFKSASRHRYRTLTALRNSICCISRVIDIYDNVIINSCRCVFSIL